MQTDFGQVLEAKYLANEENKCYRHIVRFLFLQHEKFRYQVSLKEILDHLKETVLFDGFEEADLERHLNQLFAWHNVIIRQDNRHAKSIAEFNKKHLRYQLTPLTVALERTITEWETAQETNRGGLDGGLFERLYASLQRLHREHLGMNHADLDALWEELFHYFKEFSQRATDFFAKTEDFEKIIADDTERFLEQKTVFYEYLQGYIRALQAKGPSIEGLIKEFDASAIDKILQGLIQYRLSEKPVWGQARTKVSVHDALLRQWEDLCLWFSSTHEESEMNLLQQRSVETIRKVTRMVVRLGERHTIRGDRKLDYRYLAKKFMQTADLEEAHKLSACVFGVMETRHFLGVDFLSVQTLSLWESEPYKHTVKPFHKRRGLGKRSAGEVMNRSEEKQALLREREEEGRFEDDLIRMLIKDKIINIEDLGTAHPKMRRVLLNWLMKSQLHEGVKRGTTRGISYTISKRGNEDVVLVCSDGILTMPDYQIALGGEGDGGRST